MHSPYIGVALHSLTSEIFEITDVNLHLLRVASERARDLSGGDNRSIIFFSHPRTRVSSEQPQIAYVSKAANRPQVTELLLRAVKLSPIGTVISSSEDDALQLNRDLVSDAIRSGRAEVVEELLEEYKETLSAFLTALEEHGLRYTAETARNEDGFFQDWSVVSKIQEHYRSLAEQALRSSEREIIFEFVGFPLHVMSLAGHHHDQLTFRRFAVLFNFLYTTAKRAMTDAEMRNFVFERCWRLLVKYYDYAIQHRFEEADITETEAKILGDYAEFLIIVLNHLLKSALDFRDIEQFRDFASAAQQIPSWMGRSPIDTVEDLRTQLKFVRDDTVRYRLEEEIMKLEVVTKQLTRVQEARRVSFMGLGAWLVHLLEAGRISQQEFGDYSGALASEFMDIRKIHETYSRVVSDFNVDVKFGWNSWELEERPETYGKIVFSALQNSNWVGIYYVYRAIQLSPTRVDAFLDLQPTGVSKQIAESVNKNLDYIAASDVWRSLLIEPNPVDYQNRAKSLREMHNRVAKQQEIIEEDELIRQPLDSKLVSEFISAVENTWRERTTVRGLLSLYGRYEERPDVTIPESILAFGIKQIEAKGAFVKQDRILYVNWGGNHGLSLANGEDSMLAANFSALPKVEADLNQFDIVLKRHLNEIKSANSMPIIFYSGLALHHTFFDSPNYEPQWRSKNSLPKVFGVDGLYDGVLVVHLSTIEDNVVIIVDIARFGVLVQYRPDESGRFPLSISIKEITPEIAGDLLDKQPDLVRDPVTEQTVKKDTAVRRLRQEVLVDIWERFELEKKDQSAGRRIHFSSSVDVANPEGNKKVEQGKEEGKEGKEGKDEGRRNGAKGKIRGVRREEKRGRRRNYERQRM